MTRRVRQGGRPKALLQATGALTVFGLAAAAQPAWAHGQEASAAQDASAPEDGADIIITGTRVRREGYTAATPTTIIGADDLARAAKPNIADAINLLPAVSGSATPATSQPLGGSTAGMNLINLRGLGVNRTLVLFNGHRVPPSTINGNVDVNTLPTQLIQRVDVVTGGASSSYGSDAVAGVVNFIIDTRFAGVKGLVQSGVSEEGDGANRKIELAAGTSLFGGRGHIILAGSYSDDDGVDRASSRDWYTGRKLITNPANNSQRIVVPGVGSARATYGGLINSGPLSGTQFLPGGVPAPFRFGTISGALAYGGDTVDRATGAQLKAPVEQANAFGRISFELTPSIEIFAEASYAWAHAISRSGAYGSDTITIRNDNPFLDANTLRRMNEAGVTSFTLGRINTDLGEVEWDNRTENVNFLGGLKGKLGDKLSWDAYYQYGEVDIDGRTPNNLLIPRFNLAVEAVRAPAGNAAGVAAGTIICRSTLTNPTNGCVPVNLFGAGSPSAAAIAYIVGIGGRPIKTTQEEAALNIQGELFSTWAGPVSVAVGGNYRRQTIDAGTTPDDLAGNFFLGNSRPFAGASDVKEAYAETVIPLLSNTPFFKQLDLNAAVRVADYSYSGTVTTWKVGATWDISDEFRLRGIRSTDIRAPNLNELFQTGSTLFTTFNDPVSGTQYQARQITQGNTGLLPERARTWSGGAIWHPHFLDGLQLSVDYYNIRITDAIVNVPAQLVINQCFAGVTQLCSSVLRDPASGQITQVFVSGQNVNSESTEGLDIEASYRTSLSRFSGSWDGSLNLRFLATHVFNRTVIGLLGSTQEYANTLSDITAVPSWRGLASMNLNVGSLEGTLTARYIGSGVLTYQTPVIVNNHVPATTYVDLALASRIGSKATITFNVDNLFNQAPRAAVATLPPFPASIDTNPAIYDLIGRQYRVGVRFRF